MKTSLVVITTLCAVLLVVLFNLFHPSGSATLRAQIPYSLFIQQVEAGQIASVFIAGQAITGATQDGKTFSTLIPDDAALAARLIAKNVAVVAIPKEDENLIVRVLVSWLPLLLTLSLWLWGFLRVARGLGQYCPNARGAPGLGHDPRHTRQAEQRAVRPTAAHCINPQQSADARPGATRPAPLNPSVRASTPP